MKTFDHILLGGNVASLVVASGLLRLGKSVALVAPPASIGGHFSVNNNQGYDFDNGMLLLEMDSYQQQSEVLAEYDPSIIAGSGRFTGIVAKTLQEYFTIREVKQIEVALQNQKVGDYYISNDLSGISSVFSNEQLERINQELGDCINANQLHPSTKSTDGLFDQANYREASVSNHGKTIHDYLIEPLVKKATNLSSEAFLARNHRLFWAPLYYPETLQQSIRNPGNQTLRPTVFHHPVGEPMGRISGKLLDEISGSEKFTLIPNLDSLAEIDSGWVVNNAIRTTNMVSTLPQNVLARLLDIETAEQNRSSYLIVFLKVEGEVDCEVLFNAGNYGHFFRVVNQSRLRGDSGAETYLSVEYNLDLVTSIDPDYVTKELFIDDLKPFFEEYSLGELKVVSFSVLQLKNKIVFPEVANVSRSLEIASRISGISMELMGPSLGMNASSLNDQILQAMKYIQHEA